MGPIGCLLTSLNYFFICANISLAFRLQFDYRVGKLVPHDGFNIAIFDKRLAHTQGHRKDMPLHTKSYPS